MLRLRGRPLWLEIVTVLSGADRAEMKGRQV
jgi:hypothetical protein